MLGLKLNHVSKKGPGKNFVSYRDYPFVVLVEFAKTVKTLPQSISTLIEEKYP